MAGILNSKERIIDFIITNEGLRQASSGQMKMEYASFTDYHTFYEATGSDVIVNEDGSPAVAVDASNRIFFEAANRYQDTIVPELENGNEMRPFRVADFRFSGIALASGTVSGSAGFAERSAFLAGAEIQAVAGRSLQGITQNFRDLRILGTHDEFSDTTGFELNPSTGSFFITRWSTYGRSGPDEDISLVNVPSLFADSRFAQFPNFEYLPPRNMVPPGAGKGSTLGQYPKLNEPAIMSLQDLEQRLDNKPYVQVHFSDTSRENNLIGQMFSFGPSGAVEKLSIVDFGEFADDDPYSPGKRVFFVGRIVRDDEGAETFLNVFTVVFD